MPRKTKKAAEQIGATEWEKQLAQLHARLFTPSLIFVPIRHHSPACAWHLRQLIAARKPASILIEGPQSLDAHLPVLASPALKPPVAVFSSFIDRKRRTMPAGAGDDGGGKLPAPRYGAYYPFCGYSPEFVAIREGVATGARVAFCDLDHPLQVLAESAMREDEGGPSSKVASLLDEQHLLHSEYLRELARRSGCRDTNELWDRKFESAFRQKDPESFFREVAAYCYFARLNTPADTLRGDGTLARERRMQEIIKAEQLRMKRRKETGPLLVVTGGFHTPPLALGTVDESAAIPEANLDADEVISAAIPYSFIQLDALNGYAAGMPSPGFYQRMWESPGTLEDVALDLLTELARKTRESGINQLLSTADVIAAHQQACTLAHFRGNPGPLREDLLDGIRSSFVKGSLDVEGEAVLAFARHLFCGDAVGQLPAGAKLHPLIEDFRGQASHLGLQLDSSSPKSIDLEIYVKVRHRRISRFFRILEFLDVPFARLQGGPDFVGGHNLELQIEHWSYTWSPQTESALVEASHLGSTLRDAVIASLVERQRTLANEGTSGGSLEAVTLLLVCCRLGLGDQAESIVPFVFERIDAEPRFTDAVHATARLDLLHRYRSPLESGRLEVLPQVLSAAFARACFLIGDFPRTPEEFVMTALESLPVLRELLASDRRTRLLDPELFWNACQRLLDDPSQPLAPALHGAVLGLLWSGQRRMREDVLATVRVQRESQDAQGNCFSRFLLGLFSISREATWNDREFMQEIDSALQGWDDESFHRSLPELRLAFSQHTPQETNRVGRLIAELHSAESLGEWYHQDIDEALMLRGSEAAGRLAAALKQDHLTHFLSHE